MFVLGQALLIENDWAAFPSSLDFHNDLVFKNLLIQIWHLFSILPLMQVGARFKWKPRAKNYDGRSRSWNTSGRSFYIAFQWHNSTNSAISKYKWMSIRYKCLARLWDSTSLQGSQSLLDKMRNNRNGSHERNKFKLSCYYWLIPS